MKPKPTILLMDNVPEFLETQSRLLELAGYRVLIAPTLREAEKILTENWIHLAILDIRMDDENDENDITGLILAQKSEFKLIPKIILTAYPTYESAVEALGPINGYPSAVDYVAKKKGPQYLLGRVRHAFINHIHINWDLVIDWKLWKPAALANLIESGLKGDLLLNRAEELDNLFRQLFQEKEHIRIDRLLWQRDKRIALVVLTFKKSASSEGFMVVCRSHTIANKDERHAKFPSDTSTKLSISSETTHFVAHAYTFVGNNLEKPYTLHDLYQSASDKVFNDALTMLYQISLKEWHQDQPILETGNSVEALYRQHLELSEDNFSNTDFEERIRTITSQIATIGSRISRTDKVLTFQLRNQSFSVPDPLLIFSRTSEQKEDVLVINIPGMLSGENILTDESGHVWLTDFYQAGLAPFYWNFVALEATIRFDWTETNDLLRRYELEKCLLNTEFAKPDTRDLEPTIRKPARAIQTIRRLGARTIGNDVIVYHQGIFYQAARRLADFNPAYPVTPKELARLGHILLSMAMITGKLEQDKSDGQPAMISAQSDQINTVDEKAGTLMIGHRKEGLPPQPFKVFRYLYLHANEVCSNEELLKVALEGEPSEANLHTLIRRIRNVIEADPKYPRYLITERKGYRLILSPKVNE